MRERTRQEGLLPNFSERANHFPAHSRTARSPAPALPVSILSSLRSSAVGEIHALARRYAARP